MIPKHSTQILVRLAVPFHLGWEFLWNKYIRSKRNEFSANKWQKYTLQGLGVFFLLSSIFFFLLFLSRIIFFERIELHAINLTWHKCKKAKSTLAKMRWKNVKSLIFPSALQWNRSTSVSMHSLYARHSKHTTLLNSSLAVIMYVARAVFIEKCFCTDFLHLIFGLLSRSS